jgi:hypothetical protein
VDALALVDALWLVSKPAPQPNDQG